MKLQKQKGAALIIFALVLMLAATTLFISQLDGATIKAQRDKKTTAVLAEAKAALIGFAAKSGTASGSARPGELPCPDTDNDGASNTPCIANVIGRLPWKDLGISDLRDGDDERLWYAVSANFENFTRTNPLNSETQGLITLKDTSGTIVNDGSLSRGLVAIVISPGTAIGRQDAVNQVRGTLANQNNAINYLDIAFGEDNSNFINGNTNGFIKGPIKDINGGIMLNDKLISITQDELMTVVEPRVIAAVSNALLDFYCGIGNSDYVTKGCSGAGGNRFFPRPASFSDAACLGSGNITVGCNSLSTTNHGRIPVNLINPVTYYWNATSILRGISSPVIISSWFQKNAWREQIHYAVAPACVDGTLNCGGAGGLLTLNFANTPTSRIVVTTAGKALTGQLRVPSVNKNLEANYFEDENATPLDNAYTKTAAGLFNDHSVNIP
jgi:type II secretory pathway pseudopilin PulG